MNDLKKLALDVFKKSRCCALGAKGCGQRFEAALLQALARHEEAAPQGKADVSFAELRAANLARLPKFKNKHGQLAHSHPQGKDWSPAQWLQAVIGELGEYANMRKKFERGDLTAEEFAIEGGKELADVQIYLDILAYQVGVDLGAVVVSKFNEVSRRVGCDVFIEECERG